MANWSDFFAPDVGGALPEAYGAGAPIQDPLANAVVAGVTLPKRAIDAAASYRPGSGEVPNALIGSSLEAAALPMGMAAPFAEPGAAGIFGGRLAQTADLNALQRAEQMTAQGAHPRQIWQDTGWFQGDDGQWRFEISDQKARMNPNTYSQMPFSHTGMMAGQVWHPELYSAYPDLRRMTTTIKRADEIGGSHGPDPVTGEESIEIQAPNTEQARSAALHELQHAVQSREGFAQGGSLGMFSQADDAKLARDALSYRRELADVDPGLTPQEKDAIVYKRYLDAGAADWLPSQDAMLVAHDLQGNPDRTLNRVMRLYGLDERVAPIEPFQLYKEVPGEIESRNVQLRRDMTPEERRSLPPWRTQDVRARPIMHEVFGARTPQRSWSDFR